MISWKDSKDKERKHHEQRIILINSLFYILFLHKRLINVKYIKNKNK